MDTIWIYYMSYPHDVFACMGEPCWYHWGLTDCHWLVPGTVDVEN